MPSSDDPGLARLAAKLSASLRHGSSSGGLLELLRSRFPGALAVRYTPTVQICHLSCTAAWHLLNCVLSSELCHAKCHTSRGPGCEQCILVTCSESAAFLACSVSVPTANLANTLLISTSNVLQGGLSVLSLHPLQGSLAGLSYIRSEPVDSAQPCLTEAEGDVAR